MRRPMVQQRIEERLDGWGVDGEDADEALADAPDVGVIDAQGLFEGEETANEGGADDEGA